MTWNPREWSLKTRVERAVGLVALVLAALGPFIFNSYWAHQILIETFFFGIAGASLIFLSAYGGMVSLAQTALFGIAGVIIGNLATKGGPGGTSKGLHLGWDPTLALFVALAITTAIGLIFGAVAARSAGIYFLMITLTYSVITTYVLGQVTNISGFSGIGGINRYVPGWIGDVSDHPNRLYYVSLIVASFAYVLIRYVVRTPFGISLQGVRDEPIRMSSLGYNVPLHRTLAFGFAAFLAALAGILYVWWSGQIAPGNVDLPETINLLVMAVIGGLARIEGAWLGAFAFIVIQNYVRDFTVPGLGFGGTLFGGSFNTVIGIIFLLIVLVSPGGLMGIWERAFGGLGRGGRSRPGGRGSAGRLRAGEKGGSSATVVS
jgi:branched-chain amino acid transport system permease protein